MNRDPRFELSRELAAQQTLLDQLHALAARRIPISRPFKVPPIH
jgi:hypothetical protein